MTNHIQHQLAEAGRDANPISAMFDSLARPHLDTHRGEYPSFLHWKHPPTRDGVTKQLFSTSAAHSQSPPPTPTFEHSTAQHNVLPTTTTARPHLVLGRGAVGGIWADMEQDHNQTLRYRFCYFCQRRSQFTASICTMCTDCPLAPDFPLCLFLTIATTNTWSCHCTRLPSF